MAYQPPYAGGVPPPMYNPLMTTMFMNQAPTAMPVPTPPKNSIITKFFFVKENDNRRLKIKKTTNLKGLMVHLERYVAPYVKKDGRRIQKMQYEDDEGDWMNFSVEAEWIEAIKLCLLKKKDKKMRIRIFTSGGKDDKPEEEEEEGEEEVGEEEVGEKQVEEKKDPEEEKFVIPPKYANKVKLLQEMGFDDVKLCVRLLEKHNGDLQSVVKEHLRILSLLCMLYTVMMTIVYCLIPVLPSPIDYVGDLIKFWFLIVLPQIIIVFYGLLLYLILTLWFARILFYKKLRQKTVPGCGRMILIFAYENLVVIAITLFFLLFCCLMLVTSFFIDLLQDKFQFLWINELTFHVVGTTCIVGCLVMIFDVTYRKPTVKELDNKRILLVIRRFKCTLPVITFIYASFVVLFILWSFKIPPFSCLRIHLPFQTEEVYCWELEDGTRFLPYYLTIDTMLWLLLFHILPVFIISLSLSNVTKLEINRKLILIPSDRRTGLSGDSTNPIDSIFGEFVRKFDYNVIGRSKSNSIEEGYNENNNDENKKNESELSSFLHKPYSSSDDDDDVEKEEEEEEGNKSTKRNSKSDTYERKYGFDDDDGEYDSESEGESDGSLQKRRDFRLIIGEIETPNKDDDGERKKKKKKSKKKKKKEEVKSHSTTIELSSYTRSNLENYEDDREEEEDEEYEEEKKAGSNNNNNMTLGFTGIMDEFRRQDENEKVVERRLDFGEDMGRKNSKVSEPDTPVLIEESDLIYDEDD